MNEGELLSRGNQSPDTNHGRTQFSDDQSTRGQPQLLQRAETATGQRRHDSGEIGTSDRLKKEATPDDIRHADGMPEININETTPRFEDAFIHLLGRCYGTSESPLGAILHTVEGTPGETVIEAKELTNLVILPATDRVDFCR